MFLRPASCWPRSPTSRHEPSAPHSDPLPIPSAWVPSEGALKVIPCPLNSQKEDSEGSRTSARIPVSRDHCF